jgi:predicted AAA+ superfamily ATPase
MERKMQKELLEWKKSSDRRPLLLYGARQVGKTYLILSFGKSFYKNVVYLNFEGNSDLNQIFERDLNPHRIVSELSIIAGQSIFAGDTLIFFDEIQASEKALTSLKYFCENAPEYHVVAAGSLLGVAINRKNYSFPVGKIEMKTLHPLDFEEFIWATTGRELALAIRECFANNKEFSLHQKALAHFRNYLIVGGMPAAVKEFVDTNDFDFVSAKQKNIFDAYLADMAKYASPTETTKMMAAFRSIPAQLAKENKKFQYKVIKSGARANEYETALDWLVAANVVTKCMRVTEGRMPLAIHTDNSAFKVYMADIGLFCQHFNIPRNVIQNESVGYENFKGMFAENYAAIALTIAGHQIYYWTSAGQAELDFVIQKDNGDIVPIEVKSSTNVRSKSLSEFVKRYKPSYAIRISTKNFGFENGIQSVPLYAAFCI